MCYPIGRMKNAAFASLATALALVGCSELSRPNTFRVAKDDMGKADQLAVAPDNLVRLPGPDGKPVAVPRLHPAGTPNAGKPVMPGEKVERSPRPSESAAPNEPAAAARAPNAAGKAAGKAAAKAGAAPPGSH